MALQRVTLRLTELRCLAQSEGSGGSEPYLWITYFALGAQPLPFQTGPMATITPAYDAFRTEFPDDMKAGQVTLVPPFLATASFDMDLDTTLPKLVGCAAILMEEDDTPQSSIVLGRIAYSKEIERQLNLLATKRIQTGDMSPITDAEIRTIKDAVRAKAEEAIGSNQSIWVVFRNQDDNIGVTYKAFFNTDIKFGYFDFPEIVSDNGGDRFVLSGGLSLGPVPTPPVDLCAAQRAALKAKNDEISGLQTRVSVLQSQLQHATPQQKPAIVAEINATNAQITQAEAQLPALQAALETCISHHHGPHDVIVDPPVVVN